MFNKHFSFFYSIEFKAHLIFKIAFVITFFLCICPFSKIQAQTPEEAYQEILRHTDLTQLNQIALEKRLQMEENYREALNYAIQNGLPVRKTKKDGTTVDLIGIDESGILIYDETDNIIAQESIGTNHVQAGGMMGLPLDGNELTIGLWEAGGHPRQTHEQLIGRIERIDSDDTTSHATHVSGTLIGDGTGNPFALGMAPAAQIRAYNSRSDVAEMAMEAATGLLISNHSYGRRAGWRQDDDDEWHWYGDTTLSSSVSYLYGLYDSRTSGYDEVAHAAPYYLIVKSAGNNRNNSGPPAGTPHSHNGEGTFTCFHPGDCDLAGGYNCMTTYSNAKNIISVAAVQDVAGGYNGPHSVVMTSFSSWGPTDDGRIKPDISANGVGLLSSDYQSDNSYSSKSGTSMAAPGVAGSALLLQEHHLNTHGSFMRAATLKGLIIHTADEAGTHQGPDYRFGWGLMNTAKAADLISNVTIDASKIIEQTLENNDIHTYHVSATGDEPLVFTLSWTDPPGQADDKVVNNITPKLINDLDLSVTDCTNYWMPYVLDPLDPASPAGTGNNTLDNVEKIVIQNPLPGRYTIHVSHKGELYDQSAFHQGIQHYSIIVSGITTLQEEGLTVSTDILSDYNGHQVSEIGSCDGEIAVSASGGTPPFIYQWSIDGVSEQTTSLDNLCAGDYFVTVTDAQGCKAFGNFALTEPIISSTNEINQTDQQSTQIKVFPNPFSVKTTIKITPKLTQHINLSVYNLLGQKKKELYHGNLSQGENYHFEFKPENEANGIYFYKLVDESGNITTGKLLFLN